MADYIFSLKIKCPQLIDQIDLETSDKLHKLISIAFCRSLNLDGIMSFDASLVLFNENDSKDLADDILRFDKIKEQTE